MCSTEGTIVNWCGLYVELNPIRAGLAARLQDWRWSSYNFYAFGNKDPLIEEIIDVDPYYYLKLGDNHEERQKRYYQNVEGVMNERFLKDIREKLDEGVFGGLDFLKEMREKF